MGAQSSTESRMSTLIVPLNSELIGFLPSPLQALQTDDRRTHRLDLTSAVVDWALVTDKGAGRGRTPRLASRYRTPDHQVERHGCRRVDDRPRRMVVRPIAPAVERTLEHAACGPAVAGIAFGVLYILPTYVEVRLRRTSDADLDRTPGGATTYPDAAHRDAPGRCLRGDGGSGSLLRGTPRVPDQGPRVSSTRCAP